MLPLKVLDCHLPRKSPRLIRLDLAGEDGFTRALEGPGHMRPAGYLEIVAAQSELELLELFEPGHMTALCRLFRGHDRSHFGRHALEKTESVSIGLSTGERRLEARELSRDLQNAPGPFLREPGAFQVACG